MLQLENFSDRYSVRRMTVDDVMQVFELCKENTLYYKYCPPFVTEESILDDMNALPKGKSKKDKYYVGFFMTNKSIQNQGIGTQILQELSRSLKNQGYEHIRLGWAKGNQQSESFWHKNGFSETGVSYETGGCTVIVAQRDL